MNVESRFEVIEKYGAAVIVLGILLVLHLLGQYNYLIFHTVVEVFAIVVASGIFMLAWSSRGAGQNDYLLFLGTAYLFVAIIDLVHTLAYEGVGVLPGHGTNIATQLWIGARYMESVAILMAPLLSGRRIRTPLVFTSCATVTALLLLSVFRWQIFPVCFDQSGLTVFKKASEYVISGMLIAGIVLLLRMRTSFDRDVLRMVVASIALTIASELSFTLYRDAYDIANEIGHLLKLGSFYLIYKAVIQTGIRKPFSVLLRDLKRSNDILESHNRELQTFARIMRHDLGNPLFSVEALVKGIDTCRGRISTALETQRLDRKRKDELITVLNDDVAKSIEAIRVSIQMMKKLLDGLRQVATVGYRQLNISSVNMNALFKRVIEAMAPAVAEAGASVHVDDLPPCRGDAAQLEEVFTNLLGNALKYLSRDRKGQIHIFGHPEGAMSIYCVQDNGLGIALEHQSRIFEPFHRVDRDGDVDGEGLGLPIVRKLVDRHRGRLWVESEPGRGSTFFVALPQATETAGSHVPDEL